MKTILFLSIFMPAWLMAQISPRTYELTQQNKLFYKTGDWTPWILRENASYRYYWGLNPADNSYADMIDVTLEIPGLYEGFVRLRLTWA